MTVVAGSCALALVAAFVIVHRGATDAIVLVLLIPVAWAVLHHKAELAIGTAGLLALPVWQTLGTAQLSLLRLATLGAVVAAIRYRQPAPRRLIDLAVFAFIAANILNLVLNYHQPHAGRVLSIELTPIGFYLGGRALPRRQLPMLLDVIVILGTVGALTVIYEYVHGGLVFVNPADYSWNATSSTIFRPGGVFGSPPGASTVMCLVAMIALARQAQLRGWHRLLTIVCLGVCLLALVLTFTRTALIAFAAGLLLYLWLTRSRLLRPIAVVQIGLLLALVYLVALPALQRNATFQEGVLRAGTLAARESYWSLALPVATESAHNLAVGVGTGTLEVSGNFSHVPVPSELAVYPQLITNSLHSQYVTTLLEDGLLGSLALILLLLTPFLASLRASYLTLSPLAAALAANILMIAITMGTDTVFLVGPAFAMLLLTIGLIANRSVVGPGDQVAS